MSVVNNNIWVVVFVLDEPDAFEIFLYFISSEIRMSRKLTVLPCLPHASELGSGYIHVSASEISEMAKPPILRRTLSQYLQECMQTHISHIGSRYPQTTMLVVQTESGVPCSEVGAHKRMSGVISRLRGGNQLVYFVRTRIPV